MENEVKLRNYYEVARGCRNHYLSFGNLDYKERLVRKMFFSVVYFIFDRYFNPGTRIIIFLAQRIF